VQKSESIGELAKALAVAQGQISGAKKDSENPFFKSKYADLASVWDACRRPLSENGLSVVQMPRSEITENATIIFVDTLLAHSSGEWVLESLSAVPVKDDPQGIGSCITYLRRYALGAVVGVAPEDDDGNAASRPSEGQSAPAPKRAAALSKVPAVTVTPEVQALREAIKASMKALNDAGETPQWTVERVNGMAKENFNGKTTAQLSVAELNDFAEMFSQRLEKLRKDAVEVPSARANILLGIRASAKPEQIDAHLKSHFDGKTLDELTDAELDEVDKEFTIPF